MKLHLLLIIFSITLILVLLVVVESSNDFSSNITRGSSLSTSSNTNNTSYWRSPSGNIAFGFYKLPCSNNYSSSNCTQDRYVVGIWFFNSPTKTLVWTANRNDPPLYAPSSILFTDEGNLILQMADNKDKPLLHDVPEPGLYAVMHDNGNFVLYGSNSRVIWESFDYPTDTILGGQKLQNGDGLISSMTSFNLGYGFYKLSVRQADGLVDIHNMYGSRRIGPFDVVSYGRRQYRRRSPITLNLDITGKLSLVGSDDVVLRTLYEDANLYEKQGGHDGLEVTDGSTNSTVYMYRATLDLYGRFSLCKERIDGGNISDNGNSITLAVWWPYGEWETRQNTGLLVVCITIGIIVVGFACFLIAIFFFNLV
ncbi:G-type lectin S-receptor-like serine/threonine-protein kinase RLK1 [Papaver somniferum]|uniref:G-type lectin S-receptor-like serine/threonine-protein kinase RLK1 n=1 Tax=Papaver somniferum TaxID=3469 RepID=UPI000E700A74|nr:G-type lectin S-receptor-like serine/threonine-protein kinase RLK1 [Papaver somniferum]